MNEDLIVFVVLVMLLLYVAYTLYNELYVEPEMARNIWYMLGDLAYYAYVLEDNVTISMVYDMDFEQVYRLI